MNPDIIESICVMICFIAVITLRIRFRRTKFVYIADYQAGLRFRNGASCSVLSPGGYRSGGKDPITVIDMRPHQFILERLVFQDVVLAKSVISVAGELAVCDPVLAIGKLKNIVDDSQTIVREGLPRAASHSIVDPSPEGRARLAVAIVSELNRELQSRGVEVRDLEITELWAVPVRHAVPTEAN